MRVHAMRLQHENRSLGQRDALVEDGAFLKLKEAEKEAEGHPSRARKANDDAAGSRLLPGYLNLFLFPGCSLRKPEDDGG